MVKLKTSVETDICVADFLESGTDLNGNCTPAIIDINGKIQECLNESDQYCAWVCYDRFIKPPSCINGALQQWTVFTE